MKEQKTALIKSFSVSSPTGVRYDSIKSNSIILCNHGNEFGSCCRDLAIVENGSLSGSIGMPSSHCHMSPNYHVDTAARRRLITASILCLLFMVAEIIGGVLAGSLAIMTDAAHLLTDFASFMISLFSLWVGSRPATKRMSFGWHRAEVMGALTSILLIWVVTGVLVYIAIQRLISKKYDIDAVIMLITSGVGVGVNIVMGLVLHFQGGSHGHSHGGSSQPHAHAPGGGDNINVRAAFIHVLGDFLQSVGVFIAALVIYFVPSMEYMDPICTFLFSILVLFTTITILKDVLTVLMEGKPRGIDFNEVQETFRSISGVVRVHNLRIWSLSLEKVALAAHIVVDPGYDSQAVLKEASRKVRDKYVFEEMTLQIEDFREDMIDCSRCQDLTD